MGNKNVRTKPSKERTVSQNIFFRAFLLSFVVSAVVWVLLAVIFAFVMSKQTDSSLAGKILSPVICVVSLLTGGFTAGKTDKKDAFFVALMLGCAFLGVGYGVSSAFNLSKNLGPILKTVTMAVMLLCPVVGAKISTKEKAKNSRHKRRM